MQLRAETKIAGNKTVNDWNTQKKILADFDNKVAWDDAYADYFLTRLKDRYIDPIEAIKERGTCCGEGFSIMTIICSMIEFLESTYQGKNYRIVRKGESKLRRTEEYDKSSPIFISFLTERPPFNNEFDKKLAQDFYENVRCGLLHEARTKGKWIIGAMNTSKKLIENEKGNVVVYRDNFFEAIKGFVEQYKNELRDSIERKEAFIRKYDKLCEE